MNVRTVAEGGSEATYTLVEKMSRALLKKFIWTMIQPAVTVAKTYVLGCVNWLLPDSVSLTAMPKPLMAMIEIEPATEQIEMYTKGFERP